jgi:hypothetical protein
MDLYNIPFNITPYLTSIYNSTYCFNCTGNDVPSYIDPMLNKNWICYMFYNDNTCTSAIGINGTTTCPYTTKLSYELSNYETYCNIQTYNVASANRTESYCSCSKNLCNCEIMLKSNANITKISLATFLFIFVLFINF